VFAALDLRRNMPEIHLGREQLAAAVRILGPAALRPIGAPAEEARLHGRRHSKERDAAAIAHHYDVSNAFYRLVLGSTMTYSCAVWQSPEVGLDAAQDAKHELVCRKLALEPGMRLLDVGCGWGAMVIHAARHHGVRAVGVTISRKQAELAAKRVAEAGLADMVEIRLQDYRDVHDGPYDAISSIGMFEHVGLEQLKVYFDNLHTLLRPGGRLLNHAISRPAGHRMRARFGRRSFIDRYIFPDGELHEVGSVVSAIQRAGFEARHMESLREHYALTLRAWVANLEAHWDDAVHEVGERRARIWRLYMAACAVTFEDGNNQVHQVLGVKPDGGRSGLALRERYDP
jgi:cyclopropane-fatty-acyl-phospholipid synthase